MHPFCSIIIPVRNDAEKLRWCLRSIGELDYPREQMEIIVVDGGSTDESRMVAASFGARVIDNPGKWCGPARNIGFAFSRGDIIAFCDADCTVDPLWLLHGIAALDNPRIGGVGGPIRVPQQEQRIAEAIRYFYRLAVACAGIGHAEKVRAPHACRCIPTCNLLCRREVLEQVFPFCWGLACGSDLELSRLIRAQGYTLIVLPDIIVWHAKKTSVHAFICQMYGYGEGRMHLLRRDSSTFEWMHVLGGCTLPLAVFFLMFARGSSASLVLLGVIGTCMAIYTTWVAIQARSLHVAVLSPIMTFTGLIMWSAGFLGEVFIPHPLPPQLRGKVRRVSGAGGYLQKSVQASEDCTAMAPGP